jgi:hypothetical protein
MGFETEVLFDDLEQPRVAFRRPVFLWLAGSEHDGTDRFLDRFEEAPLLLALFVRDHDPPFWLVVRDAQVLQKLEVLVLDVLVLVRRDTMRREQPVQVAGTTPVEPELDRRTREPR